jgi:hypothetical protein
MRPIHRRFRATVRLLPLLLLLILLVACKTLKVNPSFDVTPGEASQVLQQMADNPVPAKRPVVVIGGYLDPGVTPAVIASRLGSYFTDLTVIPVSVGFQSTFDACRRKVIDAVASANQGTANGQTAEVDVIGTSMGGLVARYAALEITGEPRLRISKLFTVATPHLGADLARLPSFHQLHLDMRKDATFIAMIRESESEIKYQIVSYTFLGDEVVGEENAAPSGQVPYWLDKPEIAVAHFTVFFDDRIFADIVRRLRDEEPLTQQPPSPLPSTAPRPDG